MKRKSKQRIIFLGTALASLSVLVAASCTNQKVQVQGSPAQKLADNEVDKVELGLNNISNRLASEVTKTTPFAKLKFDNSKYDLEIKSVTVSGDKMTEINVVVFLKAKNSTIVSKDRTIKITGFKTPEPGNKDKNAGSAITKAQADEEVKKVVLDFKDKTTVLASTITNTSTFETTGIDAQKYLVEVKKVSQSSTSNTEVEVVVVLKVIGSPTIMSEERTLKISGFKAPETGAITKELADLEVAKVVLEFAKKAETLASAVKVDSEFTKSAFDEKKYTLEIKSVAPEGTTSLKVVVKLKAIGSSVESKDREITITGFKDPTVVPKPTKQEADAEVEKVTLDVPNKAEVRVTAITPTTEFTKGGFDESKYTLEIKSVTVPADANTSVKVVVALKVTGTDIVSKDKEITITGLIRPETENEKILRETKEYLNTKTDALNFEGFATISGVDFFNNLISLSSTNGFKIKFDTKTLKLELGTGSIQFTQKFFDDIKKGLETLFTENEGNLEKLTNIFNSKENSGEAFVTDKAVLKFVEFLKKIATVEDTWVDTIKEAFKTQKDWEIQINFGTNEVSVKTSDTEFKKLLTFKTEFITGFKLIFKDLVEKVATKAAKTDEEKKLVGEFSKAIIDKLWQGVWVVSKTESGSIDFKNTTAENIKKELADNIKIWEDKINSISNADKALSKVKTAIDTLQAEITKAKAYADGTDVKYLDAQVFIKSLKKLGDEVDLQVAQVTTDLTNLINSIGNSFELKEGTAADMLPSAVAKDKLDIETAKKLEGQALTFEIQSFDEYGRIAVSGSIKYGDITMQIPLTPLSITFKKATKSYDSFLLAEVKDISDIKNKVSRDATIKTDLDSVKELQKKITELLALAQDDTNKAVLEDNVALYLWAEEYSKNNTADKSVALQTVKTNFLEKADSDTFSKLDYLTETSAEGRWTKLEKIMKLFSFANNTKTVTAASGITVNGNEEDLKPYKDAKFVAFAKGFFKDFITKYYTDTTVVTNNKWVLFEFVQPWFTTRLFLILEEYLQAEEKAKTIKTLERFTNSISNYGSVEGTDSKAGKKLIDNYVHFRRNFFVKNWLNLYTQNLKDALKDVQDYKTWIQTMNFKEFVKAAGSTEAAYKVMEPSVILNYVNALRIQGDFYKELKDNKSDLKFDTVNFDNLTTWFLTQYLPENITFEKVKAAKGEVLLRIIAVVYLALASNATQQGEFLTKLKETALVKSSNQDELKAEVAKITWPFAKDVWEKTILKTS